MYSSYLSDRSELAFQYFEKKIVSEKKRIKRKKRKKRGIKREIFRAFKKKYYAKSAFLKNIFSELQKYFVI